MTPEPKNIPKWVNELLAVQGIDLEDLLEGDKRIKKVVVVPASLRDSVVDIGKLSRDQVVMVRLDEKSLKALDTWVSTEIVGSRSEAAALFIKEGLAVRDAELAQLKQSVEDLDRARDRLRKQAEQLLKEQGNDEET